MTTIWQREPEAWKLVHLLESVRMPPPDSTQQAGSDATRATVVCGCACSLYFGSEAITSATIAQHLEGLTRIEFRDLLLEEPAAGIVADGTFDVDCRSVPRQSEKCRRVAGTRRKDRQDSAAGATRHVQSCGTVRGARREQRMRAQSATIPLAPSGSGPKSPMCVNSPFPVMRKAAMVPAAFRT